VLVWRPSIAQGGTTNAFAVTVSDNGIPVLSATQNFIVDVLAPIQPYFDGATVSNGLFASWVFGDFGPDYSMLGSTNLVNWDVLWNSNQPPVPFFFQDSNFVARPRQFYRVLLGP